jgi:hypothetical protein
MRFVWIQGLLIVLCTSANAATVHHPRPRQTTIVRPAPYAAPPRVRFAVPGWSDDATERWLDNASSNVGRGG